MALFTSACTTVAPAEIDPLEASSESLLEQVEFELQLTDIVLLNPHLEKGSPRADEFEAARLELANAAEVLVDYSISLIDIARIESDDAAVAEASVLFEALYSELNELPFIAQHLAGVDLDVILVSVAEQPDLTRALRAFLPATKDISQALAASVDEANELFDLAFKETYDKIVEEHRAFNAYADNLVMRRNEVLEHLLLLDAARGGDEASWRLLLASNDRLQRELGESASMTPASIDQAEDILVARLAKVMEVWAYMEPSLEVYQQLLRELYQVDTNARQLLRVASYVVEEWDKAQRQMAAGRPAGFIQVTKDLAYLALKRASRR